MFYAQVTRPYHASAIPRGNSVVLNCNHSYFLLADDGTLGKFGCEILLRRKLEKFISQQKIFGRNLRSICSRFVAHFVNFLCRERLFDFMVNYDTRCYFNVRSQADMSQLNLPHGTNN